MVNQNKNWLEQLLNRISYSLKDRTASPPPETSDELTVYAQEKKPEKSEDNSSGGMNYNQVEDIIDRFSGGETSGTGGYSASTEGTMWGNEFTAGFDSASMEMGGGGSYGSPGSGAGAGGGAGAGAGGGEAGGMGGAGVVAIIAAIIAGQMVASNNTDTEIYGEGAGNWFTFDDDGHWEPHMAQEPWRAYAHDRLGWEPTAGEKFDAAMWGDASEGEMLKNFPAAADYYADPIRSWLGYDTWYNLLGEWSDSEDTNKVIATLIDPIGGILNQINDWF